LRLTLKCSELLGTKINSTINVSPEVLKKGICNWVRS